MNKPKIYITQPIPRELESYLSEFCDYEKWGGEDDISRSELSDNLRDKDVFYYPGF